MRRAPLFSLFGAKNRIAPKYPKPQHETIIEPFAGSAGYSRLHTERQVILYERDPVIFGVLDFLIRATPEEILRLPLVAPGESIDDVGAALPQEARWLIGFWLNKGVVAPRKQLSSFGRREWPKTSVRIWGNACRERLSRSVAEIKHWSVFNCSWDEIDVESHGECTWFVDPPYRIEGHWYAYGNDLIDYAKLGGWCRSLPGQVIACESADAQWLPFSVLMEADKGRLNCGRTNSEFQEGIWTK